MTNRQWRWLLFAVMILTGSLPSQAVPAAGGEPAQTAPRNLWLRPHREPERAIPAEMKLERRMKALIAVDWQETPLKDALEHIAALQGLKLRYDADAIQAARVAMDQPVTLNLKDLPLSALFRLLLEPLQLEWIIQDEAVVITTRQVAEKHMSAWRYDVNDLIAAGIPIAALATVISAVVAPPDWVAAGGHGAVSAEESALVVRQTPPVHRELQRFLRDIRQQLSQTDAQRRAHENRVVTIRYDVADFIDPDSPPERFVDILTEKLYRATWERFGGRGKARLNGESLEVTNAQWVHERMGNLLDQVREHGLERGRNGSTFSFVSALEQAMYQYDRVSLDAPLHQTVSIESTDARLWDALRRIYETYGVFCSIRDEEIRKAAVTDAMRVKKKFGALPLGTALDELLSPFGLDWYVTEYSTVNVITAEEAAARRDLRVFRIVELTQAGHTADELVRNVTAAVEPQSWQSAGGTATIRALPGLLIVRHNRRTCERIAELLQTVNRK